MRDVPERRRFKLKRFGERGMSVTSVLNPQKGVTHLGAVEYVTLCGVTLDLAVPAPHFRFDDLVDVDCQKCLAWVPVLREAVDAGEVSLR